MDFFKLDIEPGWLESAIVLALGIYIFYKKARRLLETKKLKTSEKLRVKLPSEPLHNSKPKFSEEIGDKQQNEPLNDSKPKFIEEIGDKQQNEPLNNSEPKISGEERIRKADILLDEIKVKLNPENCKCLSECFDIIRKWFADAYADLKIVDITDADQISLWKDQCQNRLSVLLENNDVKKSYFIKDLQNSQLILIITDENEEVSYRKNSLSFCLKNLGKTCGKISKAFAEIAKVQSVVENSKEIGSILKYLKEADTLLREERVALNFAVDSFRLDGLIKRFDAMILQ